MTQAKASRRRRQLVDEPERLMVSTEMISRLQALGFAEYEARCYLGLVNGPPCTAYDISKITGVPRANVYSVCLTPAALF